MGILQIFFKKVCIIKSVSCKQSHSEWFDVKCYIEEFEVCNASKRYITESYYMKLLQMPESLFYNSFEIIEMMFRHFLKSIHGGETCTVLLGKAVHKKTFFLQI